MIELKYGDEVYQLKNTPDEIKLGEFEKIFNIANNPQLEPMGKYFAIFELLEVPDEVLDSMNQQEFIDAVQAWNSYDLNNEPLPFVEVGGRRYVSFEGEEFIFMARDISLIEKSAASGDGHFPSTVMAILFKDDQLTPTEHRDNAHIKHKAKLFRENLTADMAVPFLARVARRQIESVEGNEVE